MQLDDQADNRIPWDDGIQDITSKFTKIRVHKANIDFDASFSSTSTATTATKFSRSKHLRTTAQEPPETVFDVSQGIGRGRSVTAPSSTKDPRKYIPKYVP